MKEILKMVGQVEIERKYRLRENTDVGPLLENFEEGTQKQVVDEYFDTATGEYYQGGIFIRIRNKQSLDIKFNPDHLGKSKVEGYISCHEYNFWEPFGRKDIESFKTLEELLGLSCPKGKSFTSFLTDNALIPLLTIDKIRRTYQNALYTCVVDEIRGMGNFLELEYADSSEKPVREIVAQMDSLMVGIPAELLTAGTFELILKQKNPELYRKGKYKLAEDQARESGQLAVL